MKEDFHTEIAGIRRILAMAQPLLNVPVKADDASEVASVLKLLRGEPPENESVPILDFR
jgi:hypothetical protein